MSEKKKLALNVVSNANDHRGFGAGSINLMNVICVIIDQGEAYIDAGAMHAKSKIEKGIKFSANKEDVPNGRLAWIVWVAVDRLEEGTNYAGASACPMLIDTDNRKGWKLLPEHVNKLDGAIKRRYALDELPAADRAQLKQLLIRHNEQWWHQSPEQLKQLLA